MITGGLRNTAGTTGSAIPALASVTGILTDPQFKVVLRALEQRDGADLLNEGQATTLSGRQANFGVFADAQTIVTGANGNSTGGNVQQTGAGIGGNVVQNQAAAINYTLDTAPYGTTLDVVPYVCADGYTIQMTLIPTVTEFVQYDNLGGFCAADSERPCGGLPLTGQLPLPAAACAKW